MGELKVVLDEDLLRMFKERAYRIFGYKKGSIKEAVELALRDFVGRVDVMEEEGEGISRIRGLLKGLGLSSVELQHEASGLWLGGDVPHRR